MSRRRGGAGKPDQRSNQVPKAKQNTPAGAEQMPDLEHQSPEADAELTKLQIVKLQFETGQGRWLEIAKGILSLFTAAGVIFSIYLGISQQRQAAAYRNDDRFDHAVGRLSSHEPSERLAGLVGLQQFINSRDKEHQQSALEYLINADSLEGDATVRAAIEQTFDQLTQNPPDASVLNAALARARDNNVAMLRRRNDSFVSKEFKSSGFPSDPHYSEVLIGDEKSSENAPLVSTGKIIAALIRAGARIDSLNAIYCVECDFRGRNVDLSGVSFENAKLRRADFSKVRLENADFNNADLILTKFIGASLKGAKLTADTAFVPSSVVAAEAVGDMYAGYGTVFACADLTNAKLSGRLLFTLIYDDPIWGGNQRDEFYAANLNHTDLSKVRIGIALPMSQFSGDPTKERVPDSLLPISQLLLGGTSEPLHYSGVDPYRIWTTQPPWNGAFTLTEHFKTDSVMAFGSLHSARNWSSALLPNGFEDILRSGPFKFDPPPFSYNCESGEKKADISSMFDGSRTTGIARF